MSLFKRIRHATIGPKKVDDIVKSFHKAVADLDATANHHSEAADRARADLVAHENNAAHAHRVRAKLQTIIA